MLYSTLYSGMFYYTQENYFCKRMIHAQTLHDKTASQLQELISTSPGKSSVELLHIL